MGFAAMALRVEPLDGFQHTYLQIAKGCHQTNKEVATRCEEVVYVGGRSLHENSCNTN
jgi:hypothetical protein